MFPCLQTSDHYSTQFCPVSYYLDTLLPPPVCYHREEAEGESTAMFCSQSRDHPLDLQAECLKQAPSLKNGKAFLWWHLGVLIVIVPQITSWKPIWKNVMTLGNLTTFFFFFYVRHIIIIRKKSGGQIWPSAVPVKHHRLQIKVVMTHVLGSEVAQW